MSGAPDLAVRRPVEIVLQPAVLAVKTEISHRCGTGARR